MINLLKKTYRKLLKANAEKQWKRTNKLYWFVANVLTRVLRYIIYYSSWLRAFASPAPSIGKNSVPVIVSFTSFPARINHVWLVVDSILRQSVQPESIELYLSKINFPDRERDFHSRLLSMKDKGLKIIFVDDDLKPHKKYLYSFQRHENKCIITIDDDILYDEAMIERLWIMHQDKPLCVCANIVRRIGLDENKKVLPYEGWDIVFNGPAEGHRLCAIGCGGVLYPPEFFKCAGLYKVDVIKSTCLRADDLWLKAHELMSSTSVYMRYGYTPDASIPSSDASALQRTNRNKEMHGNDIQWKLLNNIFPLDEKLVQCRN